MRVTKSWISNVRSREAAVVVTTGLATETDTALALQNRYIGLATETDSALALAAPLGLALETDTALSLRPVRSHAIGLASETDSALGATLLLGEAFELGLASETDSALSVHQRILALAEEIDEALPILALGTPYWPFDDLQPRHIGIHPVASPIGGGVGIVGREPVIASGGGHWRIVYGGVPVKTRAQILLWRALEARFEGRGRSVIIPLYDGKRAPWVTVGGAITATANAAVAAGATAIQILATSAGEIKKGQHFSAGHYPYRIKTISGPVANVYTCTIWPKTREAIASGATLEFKRPIMRARLENDDGMALTLKHLKFGERDVAFVEDLA